VLVVGGSGYLGSTLMGDVIAELGTKNGWSGVVIFGAIRDVRAIARFAFGVEALGPNPQKSTKLGSGVRRYCRLVRRTYFYSRTLAI
jgi:regulator of ribonuclease activity A